MAKVWIKTSLVAGDNQFYVYYGNDTAPDYSNGEEVFEFFDNFDGESLSSNWTIGNGIWNIENSCIWSNNNYAYIYTSITTLDITKNYVIEYKTKSGSLNDVFFFCDANGSGQMFRIETRSSEYYSGFAETSSWTSWNEPTGLPIVTPDTWFKIKITINENITTGEIENVGTTSYTISRNGNYIAFQTDGEEVSIGDWWDYIFVRKYTDQEPTITVGSEESV